MLHVSRSIHVKMKEINRFSFVMDLHCVYCEVGIHIHNVFLSPVLKRLSSSCLSKGMRISPVSIVTCVLIDTPSLFFKLSAKMGCILFSKTVPLELF